MNECKTKEECKRDRKLLRPLKTPPCPRPKAEKVAEPGGYLIIDGKLRVAANMTEHDDGSITADVYRDLEDLWSDRAMERAARFER